MVHSAGRVGLRLAQRIFVAFFFVWILPYMVAHFSFPTKTDEQCGWAVGAGGGLGVGLGAWKGWVLRF